MKIEQIEIYGYGKWMNRTFTDLTNLHVFFGANEAGKSTLASFIQTMFFGFPSTRKKDINTYFPKKGEAYGGRIVVSGTRFGTVQIERLKDRNKGKATLTYETGASEVVEHLAASLFGVDKETYELLYTFKIDRLVDLHRVKKEELNRYLLGVGTSGSERILQVADQFKKEAVKEFKPTGANPPLNKLLKELDGLHTKLQQSKLSHHTYEQLLEEEAHLSDVIMTNEATIQAIRSRTETLQEAIRLADIYNEWVRLDAEVKRMSELPLTKSSLREWEQTQEKLTQLSKQESVLQQQISQETERLREWEHAEWYMETKEQWAPLIRQFPDIQQRLSRSEFLQTQEKEEQLTLEKQKQEWNLHPHEPVPVLQSDELEEAQQATNEVRERNEQLRMKRLVSEENNRDLEAIEKQLEEERKGLPEGGTLDTIPLATTSDSAKKLSSLPLVCYGIAAAFVIASFVVPSLRAVMLGLAVVLAVAGVFLQMKQPKMMDTDSTEVSQNQLEKRNQLERLTHEANRLNEWVLRNLNEAEQIEEQLKDKYTEQKEWLRAKGFPTAVTMDAVIATNGFASLIQKEQKLKAIEEERVEIDYEIKKWEERASFIKQRFGLQDASTRAFVQEFREWQQALLLEESKYKGAMAQIRKREEELTALAEQRKLQQDKKQSLLDAAKVEDEAAFYALIHERERVEDQKKRHQFLFEQVEGKEALMASHPSKADAIQQLQDSLDQIRELEAALKSDQKEELQLQHRIHQLEEGGTYSKLLQEVAMKETEVREAMIQWSKKVVAAWWLEDTLRNGKQDRLPAMERDFNHFFSRLTNHAYKKVSFTKTTVKVQHDSGVTFEPHELSQGTIEQLYIALRFAFIKQTADIANLPVLVDDGFVNFDPARKETMYELLKEVSETVQVLFFTFDEHAFTTFGRNHVVDLKQ